MNDLLSLPFPESVKAAKRFDLLQGMFTASRRAWKEAIQPSMDAVRRGGVSKDSIKHGTDFFTKADTESERIIVEALTSQFGENAFRIFGEEANAYKGNLDADITIRIDPIDGTEAFKFGKANWSIMIGAYIGRDAAERQIASAVYWPEYFSEVLYFLDGAGTFIGNIATGATAKIEHLDEQNDLGNIITAFYRHSDLTQRSPKDDEIAKKLEEAGARVKSLMPTEVKEALQTGGKRAIILDGDFNEVDFISYSSLVRLGYAVHDWEGKTYNIDDPDLANRRLVFTPPGKAGEQILSIVASSPFSTHQGA